MIISITVNTIRIQLNITNDEFYQKINLAYSLSRNSDFPHWTITVSKGAALESSISVREKKGTFVYPDLRYPELTKVLIAYLANILLLENILTFHASCIVSHGHAILFSGASGRGKSTISKLSGHKILSDDAATIVQKNGRFFVCQTPFEKKEKRSRTLYPIKAIYLLSKSKKNKVDTLSSVQSFAHLSQNVLDKYLSGKSRKFIEKRYNLLYTLMITVSVYQLYFNTDREFLQKIV